MAWSPWLVDVGYWSETMGVVWHMWAIIYNVHVRGTLIVKILHHLHKTRYQVWGVLGERIFSPHVLLLFNFLICTYLSHYIIFLCIIFIYICISIFDQEGTHFSRVKICNEKNTTICSFAWLNYNLCQTNNMHIWC